MQQLVSLVQETGLYPSRHSPSEAERTLAVWLQCRREEARADNLAQAYRDGLAGLPGWQTPPRPQADESRWQQRLAALVDYRAAGNDWPRHKATVEGLEHDMGVWLHYQRAELHRGELDEAKVQALDRALPGWQSGRRRGRKPRQNG
ncbi:helicase associated domain-containing protein [Arthrobacter sp. ISL-65]|uniref:helicase associated domain-containing protein n=1 Tax=Arthrobacter sp. ISL-65 TaxID=2819112 RepID=UPI001BE7B64F|nr:helicase associated domain-containing protein [Arthrobacter sp. ISL-65]MBT2548159.1 helicase associated domain-containing protein [Arthrobacter sp. ISL-65]